jgi:CheY-like chemotaxis protein
LEALRREHFDLVLMDVQMPVMDGHETARAIRADEASRAAHETRHLPIIGMTAYALAGDRERCLHTGMYDDLPKPIRTDSMR